MSILDEEGLPDVPAVSIYARKCGITRGSASAIPSLAVRGGKICLEHPILFLSTPKTSKMVSAWTPIRFVVLISQAKGDGDTGIRRKMAAPRNQNRE
jgi:hypothetical protein